MQLTTSEYLERALKSLNTIQEAASKLRAAEDCLVIETAVETTRDHILEADTANKITHVRISELESKLTPANK